MGFCLNKHSFLCLSFVSCAHARTLKTQKFGNKSFMKTDVFEDALKTEMHLYHDGQTTNEGLSADVVAIHWWHVYNLKNGGKRQEYRWRHWSRRSEHGTKTSVSSDMRFRGPSVDGTYLKSFVSDLQSYQNVFANSKTTRFLWPDFLSLLSSFISLLCLYYWVSPIQFPLYLKG